MLHKQHATDHKAASAAARLIVIPRGVRGQAQWHTFPWLQFHSRQKKEQINIAHRSTLLEAHTWTGGWVPLSQAMRTGEFQPWPGARRETRIKRRSFAGKHLFCYISCAYSGLIYGSQMNDLCDPTCRVQLIQVHPGWFPCFSIVSYFSISGPAEAHHTAFYTLQRGKGYPLLNATEYRLPL